MLCFIVFAQAHAQFRIPELRSVAELHNFNFEFVDYDFNRPVMAVNLIEPDHANLLASRCILIKAVYELYGRGKTYEEVHKLTRSNQSVWQAYVHDTSFKFFVSGFNRGIPQSRQIQIMESFSYMGLQGKIDMKNPEIVLSCFEDYETGKDAACSQIYFGRLITEGLARPLINKFDVKKRAYYGNTSMESEVSLLMANQTMASPGKIMFDPFAGTGSMIYPAAYFGALFFGSDIDGRQMRGKGRNSGILKAASQYQVVDKIIDLCTFDVVWNPLRCGDLFDAIVTDPPYGVRAGAKTLGRKSPLTEDRLVAYVKHRESPQSDDAPYIPPTKPYELSNLVRDLILLSRHLLKPKGRLVFFLPTVNDEYEDVDISTVICDGMEIVSNSLQDFGSWGRRLITIRKIANYSFPRPSFFDKEETDSVHIPAHKDFREKYFQGFKKN